MLDGGGGVAPIFITFRFSSWAGQIPQKGSSSPLLGGKREKRLAASGLMTLVREKPEICTVKAFQGGVYQRSESLITKHTLPEGAEH